MTYAKPEVVELLCAASAIRNDGDKSSNQFDSLGTDTDHDSATASAYQADE
jgi:hypothetical protein